MGNKNYSRNALLAKLHIAKAQMKLSEEDYRNILSGWNVQSSKDLTDNQIIEVLDCFTNKLGWKPEPRKKKRSKERPVEFATRSQLEKIKLLWDERSREKSMASLQKFIKRIVHVDLLESVQSNQVHVIIRAIENL